MKHAIRCIGYAARRPHVALLGIREFRLSSTTHYDYPEIESYDAGRELAHIATLRHYDS